MHIKEIYGQTLKDIIEKGSDFIIEEIKKSDLSGQRRVQGFQQDLNGLLCLKIQVSLII